MRPQGTGPAPTLAGRRPVGARPEVRLPPPSFAGCLACGGGLTTGYSMASMAAATTHPELALPTLDVRALARRAAIPAALAAAVGAAVVITGGGPVRAFADALGRAFDADPRWVAAAAAFELASFGGYIALLWLVGARATPRLDLRASVQVTLGGAAATRLVPAGGVGGAAMTIWALRRAGLGNRGATRTLLAFLTILYAVFLGAIAVSGGLLALGLVPGDGPLALSAVPAGAATLAILAGLGLAARRGAGEPTEAPAPVPGASRAARAAAGLGRAPAILGAAVRDGLSHLRSGDPRVLGALVWWAFDAAVLWAMLNAFGAPPSIAVVVLGYFVGQVANTLPIPGAVSGGMVGVLLAFGVQADLALASVLAYRAVAIWLPTPFGLAALAGLRKTVARWAHEDHHVHLPRALRLPAPAPAVPAPLAPAPAAPAWALAARAALAAANSAPAGLAPALATNAAPAWVAPGRATLASAEAAPAPLAHTPSAPVPAILRTEPELQLAA